MTAANKSNKGKKGDKKNSAASKSQDLDGYFATIKEKKTKTASSARFQKKLEENRNRRSNLTS